MTYGVTRRPGLDEHGFIAREGSLARVPPAFRPVVGAARDQLLDVFGERLHSAYLYGSIPRGTARVGRSDLDLLIVLREEPTEGDRTAAGALDAALDREFEQIDGAGTLLVSRAQVLSDLERHDLGWFLACLCTPSSVRISPSTCPATAPTPSSPARPTATWPSASRAGDA